MSDTIVTTQTATTTTTPTAATTTPTAATAATHTDTKYLLHQLVAYFGGSKHKLAEALSVSPSAVSFYFRNGYLTPESAIKVERLTEGKFKAIDLAS